MTLTFFQVGWPSQGTITVHFQVLEHDGTNGSVLGRLEKEKTNIFHFSNVPDYLLAP